uniref:Uncharacterized protein n=1 Tax=Rhizophora mucronata TaxID=61149 RepID=A0A2P2QNE5_RHIMU
MPTAFPSQVFIYNLYYQHQTGSCTLALISTPANVCIFIFTFIYHC